MTAASSCLYMWLMLWQLLASSSGGMHKSTACAPNLHHGADSVDMWKWRCGNTYLSCPVRDMPFVWCTFEWVWTSSSWIYSRLLLIWHPIPCPSKWPLSPSHLILSCCIGLCVCARSASASQCTMCDPAPITCRYCTNKCVGGSIVRSSQNSCQSLQEGSLW